MRSRLQTGWLVLAVGCGGAAATQTSTPEPEPAPAAAPAPAAVAAPPANVTAELRGLGGDGTLSAAIRVDVGGAVHDIVLDSDFADCESGDAPVETIDKIGDDRLRMVQLFCENGEDEFSRSMITALLLASPEPTILWQGRGTYSSSFGMCTEIDVLHFRRGAGATIEAVRTTEIIAEEDAEDCPATPEKREVVATIPLP